MLMIIARHTAPVARTLGLPGQGGCLRRAWGRAKFDREETHVRWSRPHERPPDGRILDSRRLAGPVRPGRRPWRRRPRPLRPDGPPWSPPPRRVRGPDVLGEAVAERLGFTLAQVQSVYRQGRLGADGCFLRSRIDARLLVELGRALAGASRRTGRAGRWGPRWPVPATPRRALSPHPNAQFNPSPTWAPNGVRSSPRASQGCCGGSSRARQGVPISEGSRAVCPAAYSCPG